jgi:hypothetical protein
MHKQVRVSTRLSPPNLQRLLQFLADEPLEESEQIPGKPTTGVNIFAAGGSRLELGGRFAFAPDHLHEQACRRAMARGGYGDDKVSWFSTEDNPDRLRMRELEDEPGALLAFVSEVRSGNADGFRIKDILVGTERIEGRVPVQIFSVPVPGDLDDEDDDDDDDDDDGDDGDDGVPMS